MEDFQLRFSRLSRDLLELARELIPRSPTATEAWLANPDGVEEHKPEWHQWGIVTHSRLFTDFLAQEVPLAFKKVGTRLAERLAEKKLEVVDGMNRGDLMQVAGLWHDLGKFATRRPSKRGGYNFIGHAAVSGTIIRDWLGDREGFTKPQIAYIAHLADLHFAPMELKLSLMGRNKMADSPELYKRIAQELGDVGFEIMAFFWADTLAKGSTPRQEGERPLLWKVFEQGLLGVEKNLETP